MSFTTDLLDRAIKLHNLPSDYALAPVLGVSRATVSTYRTGRSFPSESTACRLADLAGLPHIEAIMGVNLDRANTPEGRTLWRSIGAELLAGAAARQGH